MFQPWYLGEPNGDTLENCAIVWTGKDAWNDQNCNEDFCGFCEFDRAPDLQIRGTFVFCKTTINDNLVVVFRSMFVFKI